MWPLTSILSALEERKLRHECLDEILGEVKQRGIELLRPRLTAHRVDPPMRNINNYMRRELEKVKKQRTPYRIEFLIGEPVDNNYDEIIGEAKNPNYGVQMNEYHSRNAQISQTLNQIAEELGGEWTFDLGKNVLTAKEARELGLPVSEVPIHFGGPSLLPPYYIMFQNISLKGPRETSWIENQEPYKIVMGEYQKQLKTWKETPLEVWQEKSKEGIICDNCHGDGQVVIGGYQENPLLVPSDCNFCGGAGRIFPGAIGYMQELRPLAPELRFCLTSGERQQREIAWKRGLDIEAPSMPKREAYVKMKII